MTSNIVEKMETCARVEKYAREDYQLTLEDRLTIEIALYEGLSDEEYSKDKEWYEDRLARAFAKVRYNQGRLEWLEKLIDLLEHEPQFEDYYEGEG